MLLATKVTAKDPVWPGIPLIQPVLVLTIRPVGRLLAE
jgi:hypothetical protein